MPTVSLILKELYAHGLVKKTGTLKSSGGRKPTTIALSYDAKLSAGIEITQNHLRFVLIDLNGNVLYYKKIREFFQNDDLYFREIAESLKKFLLDNKIDPNVILGVGIAFPGVVNTRDNILEYSPTLKIFL